MGGHGPWQIPLAPPSHTARAVDAPRASPEPASSSIAGRLGQGGDQAVIASVAANSSRRLNWLSVPSVTPISSTFCRSASVA